MNRLVYANTILALLLVLLTTSCDDNSKNPKLSANQPLFKKLSIQESGIDFRNEITENEVYNHILKDVVFNGGGVAVIDINKDGLQDLYFAGNMVDDKLYLNKGNLQFEDITATSGIKQGTWSTAVSVADVNNDGFLDFYVGKFMVEDASLRQNHLYINNGDLTFTESAAQYGLNDNGHCTAVNFFDYDKDGDMDLYVGNQPYVSRHIKYNKNLKIDKTKFTDRLYRNDGGKFTDVTLQAGTQTFNFTLSATVSDLNNDGWPDLYVASDYEEPDYYFQNNGNGTFTNVIHKAMRHISNFSMGVDLADFNNDGWIDLYCADMAPADNYRSKANMSGMNPKKFWGLALNGYHYQYMFNTMQLNNGNGTFSEIGHLAGVAQTDWSWATLFADYDNDGDKDLYVSNGQPRDTRNKDYIHDRKIFMDSLANIQRAQGQKPSINSMLLVDLAPFEKLANYMFVNNGDLSFTDQAIDWGLSDKTWTQGGAYADLDNDGDMDLIIHNMNDPTYVYENRATQIYNNHFLKVKLRGDHGQNILSYGAKVWIFTGDEKQVLEVSPNRGYMSSSDPILHFGLGTQTTIDRLIATWPNGKYIEIKNVAADQLLTLDQQDATMGTPKILERPTSIFKDHTLQSQINFVHQENNYDDYKDEVLVPHRMSRLGPCSAVADVNGDGLEDLFIGGAAGASAVIQLQRADGTFASSANSTLAADKASEDIDALFFDADGDGDQDLYVASGGNEYPEGHQALQDRLYINDGKGNFKKKALPSMKVSSGVAKAGDIDGDNDLDLFIGGRQVPNKYGYPAASFILQNDSKGGFADITKSIAPELEKAGMVSDAQWIDLDQDQDQDLVIVGEWMPITVLSNEGNKLTNQTQAYGLENTTGWWNKLELADMDGDGDMDFIAGNLGLNIKYKASNDQPFTVRVKDFDGNGTNDVYLGYYSEDGTLFPVRGRQCSSEQMPFIAEKFKNYDAFAKASFNEVLGDLAEGAIEHEVKMFESVYIENKGNGQLAVKALPNATQVAPIFGVIAKDFNGDGHKDLLVAGNYYEREVETTRSDAGIGTMLLGNGTGEFKAISAQETGLLAYLDVRDLALVNNTQNDPYVFILNNNAGLQVYKMNSQLSIE